MVLLWGSCSQSTARKTKCAGDRCTETNALAKEKSPYLLQHARNPVKWYPWGKEAFAKAKGEDKPIFLSIGYSTCHWCHVMAHESFENKEVARLMNKAFISIKVDREERPDIDDVYMTVARVMTGRGGWPLTVIMTPDKKPFYVGTYIAYQATRTPLFAQTAREIFAFVQRELTSKQGAFYSALDADSEGREGAFYVWTESKLRGVLTTQEAALAIAVYNVRKAGNFTDEATGRRTGENILHRKSALTEVAKNLRLTAGQLKARLEPIRKKLLKARAARPRPSTDDKVLTDWNGLMIAAFARGARVLSDPALATAARRAADFVLARLRRKDGRLLHRYRDGQAAIGAFVPDYAYLSFGLIELYQATFKKSYLRAARDLTRTLVKHHWDGTKGGFFHRAHDGETLLVRRKRISDGARPSGNSVAALNLAQLSLLLGDVKLHKLAKLQLNAFALQVNLQPAQHAFFLLAADFVGGGARKVAVAGQPEAADTKALFAVLRTRYLPNTLVLLRPTASPSPPITRLVKSALAQTAVAGKATAYVCLSDHCLSPVSSAKELIQQLTGNKPLGL